MRLRCMLQQEGSVDVSGSSPPSGRRPASAARVFWARCALGLGSAASPWLGVAAGGGPHPAAAERRACLRRGAGLLPPAGLPGSCRCRRPPRNGPVLHPPFASLVTPGDPGPRTRACGTNPGLSDRAFPDCARSDSRPLRSSAGRHNGRGRHQRRSADARDDRCARALGFLAGGSRTCAASRARCRSAEPKAAGQHPP
jgi:hypothetical protein